MSTDDATAVHLLSPHGVMAVAMMSVGLSTRGVEGGERRGEYS